MYLQDIRFLGQTTAGVYADDDGEGIDVEALHEFYGYDEEGSHTGEEESDSEGDESPHRVPFDQQRHVRHDPVDVPPHNSPF